MMQLSIFFEEYNPISHCIVTEIILIASFGLEGKHLILCCSLTRHAGSRKRGGGDCADKSDYTELSSFGFKASDRLHDRAERGVCGPRI